MSGQSGGSGYGKVKKSCQTGGADGWAKHCGSTDDHKLSNRTERRLGKYEIEDELAPRMRGSSRRRDKVPTRKHLMDRMTHWRGKVAERQKDIEQHKEKHGQNCACRMYCTDRWIDKYYAGNIAKVLKDMEKYGYEKP